MVEGRSERLETLERTLAALREDYEVANILLGLSGALAEVRSLEETLGRAVRTIPGLFGAERSLVGQWQPESGTFAVTHTFGYIDTEVAELHSRGTNDPASFPYSRRAIEEKSPVFVSAEEPHAPGAVIVIPLSRWEADFGALRIEFDEPREFTSRDRDLARGVAHQLGHALSNARRFNLLQNLRSFGSAIGERLRYGDVLRRILSGASSLLDCDGAWIYTIDNSSSMFVSTAAHEGGVALPERLARASATEEPWSRVLRGETVIWNDAVDFHSPVPLSLAVTPLATKGKPFGALMVVNKRASGLGPDDQEAFCVLATQGAQAMENSRRFERERSVARSLQNGLLRTESPDMQGCDFGAIYQSADAEADIGGDFYDLIDLPHGRLGLVVGDVSGKGAEAAAQTAMVKYMLRAFAIQDESPATTLYRLNNALARDMSEDRFITLVYATFDPKSQRCSIAGAGHPSSLIYRRDRAEIDSFDSQGPAIGIFENETFGQTTTDIYPGDVFLAYTDGLIEARSGDDFFGEERVEAYLAANHDRPAAQISAGMYEEARRFGSVGDDTVVITLVSGSLA